MSQLLLRKSICVLLFVSLVGPASADVVLSQSNAPQTDINAEIIELLGGEKAAFAAVSPNQFERLSAAPVRKSSGNGSFSYSTGYLATLPTASGNAQWYCLSEALYFEARGESVKGQFAVAEVIMNRVDSASYPSSACKVIRQGTGRKFACQFTYTCDGNNETIRDRAAWTQVGKIARQTLDGKLRDLTGGATHYHTHAVKPRWSRVFPRTAAIGAHYFYRQPVRTASNN